MNRTPQRKTPIVMSFVKLVEAHTTPAHLSRQAEVQVVRLQLSHVVTDRGVADRVEQSFSSLDDTFHS